MRRIRACWSMSWDITLKNHGDHSEHNFGHGRQHLAVVFAMLMMLAFLVDQAQQVACRLFQAILRKEGCKMEMWQHVRALFYFGSGKFCITARSCQRIQKASK
ncbi:MAG: hypothetical protein GY801_30260 [bacterium]|nr:hypothetical protein [bacterium]